MKKNEKQESSEKQEKNEKELKLTEQQIADFTRLAELQKDGDANSSSRKPGTIGNKYAREAHGCYFKQFPT